MERGRPRPHQVRTLRAPPPPRRAGPRRRAEMRQAYAEWVATMPPIPADADYDLRISERDMPGAHLR